MYGDGDGLWLQVREIEGGLSKAWIFRFMFAGRARYMGLGPLRQVPLAKARARAEEARDLIYAGADPIEDRRQRHDEARNQSAERLIFKDAAKRFLDLHRDELEERQAQTAVGEHASRLCLPVIRLATYCCN